MSMADSDILPAACTWVFPTMGIMQFNKNATERAKEDLKGVMKALNDHLLAKTFLVGERISLADIAKKGREGFASVWLLFYLWLGQIQTHNSGDFHNGVYS